VTTKRRGRRSLAVWGALAAVLVGIYLVEETDLFGPDVFHDIHGQEIKEEKEFFPIAFRDIAVIEIEQVGVVYRFAYDGTGTWVLEGRSNDAAVTEVASYALDVFSRTKYMRDLGTGADGEDYGMAPPEFSVALYDEGAPEPVVRYDVGDVEPDELRQYVRRSDNGKIITIPVYQVDNLEKLIIAVSRPAN
jgi:hypothetical protein